MIRRLALAGVLAVACSPARDEAPPPPEAAPAPAGPARIVSLTPGTTRMLEQLGVADRIVGVTEGDAPSDLPRVGPTQEPSYDLVAALHPDIVVTAAHPGASALLWRLKTEKAPFFAMRMSRLEHLLLYYEQLGEAVGRPAEGRRVAQVTRDRLREISARVPWAGRPKVLFVVTRTPLLAAGPETYPADLLDLGGCTNVLADAPAGFPALTEQDVIAAAPEVIIDAATDDPAMATEADVRAWWGRLKGVPAVDSGRIIMARRPGLLEAGPSAPEDLEWIVEVLRTPGNGK